MQIRYKVYKITISLMNYWSEEETERLIEAVKQLGSSNWNTIAELVKTRNPEQCRQKFMRFKDINKGISEEEEYQLIDSIFNNWEGVLNNLVSQNPNQSKLYLKKRLDHYKQTLCERYWRNVMLGIKKEKHKGKINGYFDSKWISSTSWIPVKLEFEGKNGKKFKIIKKSVKKRKIKRSTKEKTRDKYGSDNSEYELSDKENWNIEQDKLLLELFETFGDNWTSISKFFKDRLPEDLEARYRYLKKDKIKNAQEFTQGSMYGHKDKSLRNQDANESSKQNDSEYQSQLHDSSWLSEDISQDESSRIDIAHLLSNPYSQVKNEDAKANL